MSAASAWAVASVRDALGLDERDPRYFPTVRLALARIQGDEETARRMRVALEELRRAARVKSTLSG
jgi:hypothetical protein